MKKRILSLLCALFLLHTVLIPALASDVPLPLPEKRIVTSDFLASVTDGNGTKLEKDTDGYLLLADGGGSYTLKIDSYAEKNLILAVKGNHGGHSLSLTFSEDGETYRSTSVAAVSLWEGEETSYYLIDVPSDMAVTHIRLRLSGAPGAHLYLVSVEPPLSSSNYRKSRLGEISSATFVDGNTLSVRGSLDSDASIEYLSYKLVLFALKPTESLSDLSLDSMRLEELSVSQKFDFRVRPDATTAEMKYVVALVNEKECIPISDPFYAYPKKESDASIGYKGVYADGSIDPYAAGAQTALVDFDLNRLLRPDEEGGYTKLYIIDGIYYNLDISYMNQIRRTLELSHACGIQTILHLEGILEIAEQYTIPVALRALVNFLCEEYGNENMISGIILGSEGLDMVTDQESLFKYSTMLHLLALLTSKNMDNVMVYGEIHYNDHASEALCQLAAAVQQEGTLSYGVYFHSDIMSSTAASRLNSLAGGKSSALPLRYGLLWEVDENIQLAKYDVYASQLQLNFDTFAIHAGENTNPSLAIAHLLDFDKATTHTTLKSLAEPPVTYVGSYLLEEFDRNTSTALWKMGAGVQSVGIGYSTLFSRKVLVIHPEQDATHTAIVYKPIASLNLTHAPYVHVSFAVSVDSKNTLSDDDTTITGKLELLSGSNRAVISLPNIPANSRLDINASLKEFQGISKIDAIVLTIEGENIAEINVENISLYSTDTPSDEIPTRIFEESNSSEEEKQVPTHLILGLLLFLTLAVPVLFLIRGKDEDK